MYSLPISETLAALTIASAASTDPIRPLVSTIPKASCGTVSPLRETVTRCQPDCVPVGDPVRSGHRANLVLQFEEFVSMISREHVRLSLICLTAGLALAVVACSKKESRTPPV